MTPFQPCLEPAALPATKFLLFVTMFAARKIPWFFLTENPNACIEVQSVVLEEEKMFQPYFFN